MAHFFKSGDVEAQTNGQLYPNQMETPQLRWAFIRKVYSIISFQLALTIAVAAAVVFTPGIPQFFLRTTPGVISFVSIFILTLLISIALWFMHKKHPWNYLLLILFTIGEAILIGLSCAFKQEMARIPNGYPNVTINPPFPPPYKEEEMEEGMKLLELSIPTNTIWHLPSLNWKIVMLAVILTTVVVVSLTAYTFWAVKRGHDFAFLGPFLFAASLMLLAFVLMQIFLPMGPLSRTIFAALVGILACAYIVYDTDNIIKRLSYDEYIMGALSIYIDIVQLFLSILALLSGNK